MGTSVVTGSASGIGAAVRGRLEKQGDRVIGVDLRDAEVEADLSDAAGRRSAVSAALELCGGRLDRVVACAGLGPQVRPPSRIVSVNYFGSVELLDGLLDALAQGERPAAVAIVSNSAQFMPLDDSPFIAALMSGDETGAGRIVDAETNFNLAYMGSKNGLGRALRYRSKSWGERGVRLNGVAPGSTQTPLLDAGRADPQVGKFIDSFPVPLGRIGQPDDIASMVTFLLGEGASFVHGSIVYVDGGSDALIRPDRY